MVAAADDAGHLKPPVGVESGHDVEVEPVALRLHAHDPDGGVPGPQHEVVARVARRLRQVAEQVAGAEPAGHGDRSVAIAGRFQGDGPDGGALGRVRPPRVVGDQDSKLAARRPGFAEQAFRQRRDAVVRHPRVVRLEPAHVPERALDIEEVPLVGDRRGDVERADAPLAVADEHILQIALRRRPYHHRLPMEEAGIGIERSQSGRNVTGRLGGEKCRGDEAGERQERDAGRRPPPPGVRRRPDWRDGTASVAG